MGTTLCDRMGIGRNIERTVDRGTLDRVFFSGWTVDRVYQNRVVARSRIIMLDLVVNSWDMTRQVLMNSLRRQTIISLTLSEKTLIALQPATDIEF